jgi:arginine decarboxylase-like protein
MQMVHPAVPIARSESITVALVKILAHRAWQENTTMPLIKNLVNLVQQENTVPKLLELLNPIVKVVALVNTVMWRPDLRIVYRVFPVHIKMKMHK